MSAPPGVFVDEDGDRLRFFLPMSLPSRHSFKEKIEANGGVLVQSELMENIIKIGDPAKPQCFDASWVSFKYIDDAIRAGVLPAPEFYVMPDTMGALRLGHNPGLHIPEFKNRATPSSGGLPNGVGSRGQRMEFTPEEDDVLRRIVHRPGVATSGNKIYQLIAAKYGGHSFHSWRDRYIRHMRPIWGPPTDTDAMDVNPVDHKILEQSYLRAPHATTAERTQERTTAISAVRAGSSEHDQTLTTPATPPAMKKSRAAFSTTDDEILLRALLERGEIAATYKFLGKRHPHHTWESWKNRIKALKKKNNGNLPNLETMHPNFATSADDELDPGEPATAATVQNVKTSSSQQVQHGLVDANIDPTLQSANHMLRPLSKYIAPDKAQDDFEEQMQGQSAYIPDQQMHLQHQPQVQQQDDPTAQQYRYMAQTEQILAQQMRDETTSALHIPHQGPSKKRDASHLSNDADFERQGTRHINIHDPTLDENAGRVSDIEDATQPPTTNKRPKRVTKKRKTNAAAQAAAARAAAVPRLNHVPMTPSRMSEVPNPSDLRSAKQEHHERERLGLVDAARDHLNQEFTLASHEPRTRAARARAASQEPQSIIPSGYLGHADQWTTLRNETGTAEDFVGTDIPLNDISTGAAGSNDRTRTSGRNLKSHAGSMEQIDENGFLQTDDEQTNELLPTGFAIDAIRSGKLTTQQEVLATPNTSPVRLSMSQYKASAGTDPGIDFGNEFEPPSPTPDTPNRSFSQSQFLQDTQSIRGDLGFDFVLNDLGEYDPEVARKATEAHDSAQIRKANWVERQAKIHRIPLQDAEAAWYQTSGVQSLATKIVQAYSEGKSPQRAPGIWTDEDDRIIQSADAAAIAQVDAYHGGQMDMRLIFLENMNQ